MLSFCCFCFLPFWVLLRMSLSATAFETLPPSAARRHEEEDWMERFAMLEHVNAVTPRVIWDANMAATIPVNFIWIAETSRNTNCNSRLVKLVIDLCS